MSDTPSPVPTTTVTSVTLPLTALPTATVVTPGWRTSEFWLKVAAVALTALFASGAIPTTGTIATVTAIAATMLGALGYTVARTMVKTAGPVVVAFLLFSAVAQVGCGATSKAAGKAALADAVDCTTSDRVKLETQFGPTVEQALLRATGGDGKIDLPSLNEIGKVLEADGWCVLEKSVARLLLAGVAGTASAAAPLDAKDLAAKVATLRAAKFGATRFQLEGSPQ